MFRRRVKLRPRALSHAPLGTAARCFLMARRIEKESGLEARQVAAAIEKKRHAKLRRARERENRKKAALEKARHDEEMARIERWDRRVQSRRSKRQRKNK